MEKRCPEVRRLRDYSVDVCSLNDKPCLLETKGDCPIYGDWLFEERQKELDHPKETEVIGLVPNWLQEFEKEAGYKNGT